MKPSSSSAAALLFVAAHPIRTSCAFQVVPPTIIATRTLQTQVQAQYQIHRDPDPLQNHPFQTTRTRFQSKSQFQSTRLYGSTNKNESSFLKKAAEKVKSINPFSKSNSKSSSQITQKQQAQADTSTAIDTMLKDAPLGIRMMGKMMKPIVSSLVGGMAQAMEEQQQQMADTIAHARDCIVQDPNALAMLGEPVEMGSVPFNQSSSTMSVNGETRSQVQATLEVRGGKASGVVTVRSVNGNIDMLSLNVGGRTMAVDVTGSASKSAGSSWDSGYASSSASSSTSSSSSSRGVGKNRNMNDDGIIDAEFVEKK